MLVLNGPPVTAVIISTFLLLPDLGHATDAPHEQTGGRDRGDGEGLAAVGTKKLAVCKLVRGRVFMIDSLLPLPGAGLIYRCWPVLLSRSPYSIRNKETLAAVARKACLCLASEVATVQHFHFQVRTGTHVMMIEVSDLSDSDEARVEAAKRIGLLLHAHVGKLWADED